MNDNGTSEDGTSPAERLLALIGEHRDTVREALDDEQHALLLTRLGALAAVAPDDDRAVRKALQGVRLALLPLPFDHPVYVALDSLRLVQAPPGPTTVAGARDLVTLLASPSSGPAPGTSTDPGQERLLRAPALSAAEARARCGGAAPPAELIRLTDPQGGDRYPEFQFTADSGTPREVVLQVNRLLLADIDPWGAAAWWLSGNSWLGGTPASLLGRLPDHRLVGAATALVEGD
ncbi:hypothetical protein I2W78_08230 [Streptomyces spinoverrucosus]|uniref:hypothetical protein n=1 Tax=Streptomyces spinoverrucosus TaxID=284043 RepID=UPI0018C38FC9|nr:hypothetical protein [Streptomyces spinoverrucosus]MBG0851831.1 hypothetical protein [Streptomyces spinoverrucosus]